MHIQYAAERAVFFPLLKHDDKPCKSKSRRELSSSARTAERTKVGHPTRFLACFRRYPTRGSKALLAKQKK